MMGTRLLLLLFTLLAGLGPGVAEAQEMRSLNAVAAVERPPVPEGWITDSGLHALVHVPSEDLRVGQRLSEHAERSIPRIARELALPTGPRMSIYLSDSERRFGELQPGDPPSWADGTAYPTRGLIFLKSPRIRPGTHKPLTQVLDHEIVHVLLGQAFAPEPTPRWLQEGLAQWLSGEATPDKTRTVQRAGTLIALADLADGFPADPVRADLAYAESVEFIKLLAHDHGVESVQALIASLARDEPFPRAFRAAFGRSVAEVDAQFQAEFSRANWTQAFGVDSAIWWGSGGFVLFGGWIAVRLRNRRTLRRWAREEAAEDALYAAIEAGLGPRA